MITSFPPPRPLRFGPSHITQDDGHWVERNRHRNRTLARIRHRYVGQRDAARACGITVERLREDHAAGRLPYGLAALFHDAGLCFDLQAVRAHYAEPAQSESRAA